LIEVLRRYRELALTLFLVALGIASVFWFGRNGWHDWEPNGGLTSGKFFCETVREGTIRQPINTWSNLGFISVGLLVAWRIGRDAASGTNHLTGTRSVPLLYALLAGFLGVGSMYLHASWTRTGGAIDVSSMFVYASFLIAHGLTKRRSAAAFFLAYFAITIPLLTFYLATRRNSDQLFGGVLGAFLVIELATWRRTRADRRWFLAAIVSLVVAFGFWLGSRNKDSALCCAECWFQGHATWHLLDALGVYCLYRYFRSEEKTPPATSPLARANP
jgi:hypothetical protein